MSDKKKMGRPPIENARKNALSSNERWKTDFKGTSAKKRINYYWANPCWNWKNEIRVGIRGYSFADNKTDTQHTTYKRLQRHCNIKRNVFSTYKATSCEVS